MTMEFKTVVVGYDGSSNGREALRVASDATGEGGTVHVVTAFHAPPRHEVAAMIAALPDEFKTSYDVLAIPRDQLNEATTWLADRGIQNKGHFVEDDPASAILDTADQVDADLIVVGSRGLGRGTRFVRGSVSSRVASHARRTFIVVHEAD